MPMVPQRRPALLPNQQGPSNPNSAAGTESGGLPMPMQGGRVGAPPPMPMGGPGGPGGPGGMPGMPPGLAPQAPPQPELPPPIMPTAGGPTSPFNIAAMLQPKTGAPGEQAPGQQPGQTPLPPWGGDGPVSGLGGGGMPPAPGAPGAGAPPPGPPPPNMAPGTLPGAPPMSSAQTGAGQGGAALMLRLMKAMGAI